MGFFPGGMGQGACGGYFKGNNSVTKNYSNEIYSNNNNNTIMGEEMKLAQLEEILKQKNAEIEALQVSAIKGGDRIQKKSMRNIILVNHLLSKCCGLVLF